jgi:hypothetical protein
MGLSAPVLGSADFFLALKDGTPLTSLKHCSKLKTSNVIGPLLIGFVKYFETFI